MALVSERLQGVDTKGKRLAQVIALQAIHAPSSFINAW